MNKLFTRIMASIAGFAMAIGVGAGINSIKQAKPVFALNYNELYSATFTDVATHSYTQNKTFSLGGKSWTASVSQVNGSVFYLGCNSNNASKGVLNNNSTFSSVVTALRAADATYNSNYTTAHAYSLLFDNSYSNVTRATFNWAGTNNIFQVYLFGYLNDSWEKIASGSAANGATESGSIEWTGDATTFDKFAVVARPGAAATTATSKTLRASAFTIYENAAPSKNLSSIALSGSYPTDFIQGDEFSHEGMIVTATYDDASTADVTNAAVWSSPDMSTAGNDKTVTVTYEESNITKTADYTINVAAATMYSIGGTITNGSLSNTTSIREGNELNINIVADSKYSLPNSIEVTMGGNALTVDEDYLYDPEEGAIYIASVTGNIVINAECSKTKGLWDDYPYTVNEARAAIDAGKNTSGVFARGIVSEIVTEYSSQYGNVSFNISEDGETNGNQLQAYRCAVSGASDVEVGDTVLVTGNLTKYNSTYEFAAGCTIAERVVPTFTVTYDANGATSGSVPVDDVQHSRHSNVTVASNTGNLAKTNYVFNGWNTKADPSDPEAEHYDVGDAFEIIKDVTLYAEWLSTSPSITVQSSLEGYSGSNVNLSFSYGNIADVSNISVVSSNVNIIVGSITANDGSGNVQLTLDKAGEAILSFRNNGDELATCTVSVTQSTVTITGMPTTGNVYIDETLDLGSTISVSKVGAFDTDVTWESSDVNIATVDNNGIVTGKAYGTVDITVTSVDYPSEAKTCTVTVTRAPDLKVILAEEIEVGDTVILACDGGEGLVSQQYYGPSNTSTVYGIGESYTTTPNKSGTTLEVVAGNSENTFAFKIKSGENANKYLSWTTGNSLNVNSTLSDNTSWNVNIDENGNAAITNATTPARQIWWNVSSPRFACYTDKSNGDGYKYTQLWKVVEPEQYLSSVTTYATLIGNETDNGGSVSVDSVAIRFGARMSQEIWEAVNANWPITDYGVMLTTQAKLNTYEGSSIQEAYKLGERRFTVLHSDSSVAPSDYAFYARINYKNPENYGGVTCAAPFIVAGGRYYFFTEMQFSVNTLAQYHLTHGGTSLSDAALNALKG